jgi:hypothetical protein
LHCCIIAEGMTVRSRSQCLAYSNAGPTGSFRSGYNQVVNVSQADLADAGSCQIPTSENPGAVCLRGSTGRASHAEGIILDRCHLLFWAMRLEKRDPTRRLRSQRGADSDAHCFLAATKVAWCSRRICKIPGPSSTHVGRAISSGWARWSSGRSMWCRHQATSSAYIFPVKVADLKELPDHHCL